MRNKKSILKKYTGKGGIINDTIKEIPNTLQNIGKGIYNVISSNSLVKKGVGKVKQIVKDRIQAQENFRNRKDNSNYYGGYKDFLNK